MDVRLVMDERGRILIPKRIREKLKARAFRLIVRDDGVLELHPLYDPLSLKGSVKLDLTVEEIEESGEDYVLKRTKETCPS